MAVEDDLRELRNDFREVWGEVRKISTSQARMEAQQEAMVSTVKEHTRPCKDMIEVKEQLGILTQKALSRRKDDPATAEAKEARSTLRLVLSKIVIPLVGIASMAVGYFCAKEIPNRPSGSPATVAAQKIGNAESP